MTATHDEPIAEKPALVEEFGEPAEVRCCGETRKTYSHGTAKTAKTDARSVYLRPLGKVLSVCQACGKLVGTELRETQEYRGNALPIVDGDLRSDGLHNAHVDGRLGRDGEA